MIIKKVRACGFQRLFEGYKDAAKLNKAGFGSDFGKYIQHAMLSIELEDLTTMEKFYLKTFCSELRELDMKFENFVNKEKQMDVHQKLDAILSIHGEMIHDSDIDANKCNLNNILPVGCMKHHVLAIFKGDAVMAVTGAVINEVFTTTDNEKHTSKTWAEYAGDEAVESNCAGRFVQNFYSYMLSHMKAVDAVSMFEAKKNFFDYSDAICNIAYVNTPFGQLNFLGTDPQNLALQVDRIKASQTSSPYVFPEDITIGFVFNTTFNLFSQIFFGARDSWKVVEYENLNLVYKKENVNVSDDIITKYNARISSAINYINSFKVELDSSQTVDLNKFNFIFNGTPITYTVQMSMAKVKDFVATPFQDEEITALKNDINTYLQIVESVVS